MHHVIKVVFRTIKSGADKGDVECVYADVRREGFETVIGGDTYSNAWLMKCTRPATTEEYAPLLGSMNRNGRVVYAPDMDTYEFIPVRKRTW